VNLSGNPKIDSGVSECLQQCKASRTPWTTASQFVETLKQSSSWADYEIIELQTRVIRALLNEP
jgi:hypothetical protein